MKVEALFGFERLPMAALVAERGGTVVAANDNAVQLGLPRPGAKIWASSPQLAEWWAQLVADQGATDVEVENHAGKRVMRIALSAREHDGQRYVLACVVDITQRIGRLAEQQQHAEARQRLEAIGVVAGSVAHEFDSQLAGVVSEASMLREDESLPEDARDALARIDAAARRLNDLTRQLLAFAGRGRFVTATLDPDALVVDTRPRLVRLVPPSVALEVRAEVGQVGVEADRSLLRQVILELVANAVDAVGLKGTIEIVTRRARVAERDWWELEIHDDGAGMDDATREHMFDPFFSTKPDRRGLGLSAVAGIVRRLGGEIGALSRPGFGTTLRVRLPALGDAPPRRRQTSELLPLEQLTGLAILVADDEVIVRNTVRRALLRRGATPVVATDGNEAELALRTQAFDVVLLDVAMPHKGGYELVRVTRETQPKVPVVLMSGYAEQVGGEPPDAFIEKPFTGSQLETKILEALRVALGGRE